MFLKELTIPHHLAKQRIDKALSALLPEESRTQIQRWIRSGHVCLNQIVIKKIDVKVEELDQIDIKAPNDVLPSGTHEAEAIPLDIIFEDDFLIVVNKPAQLVVHPGAGNAKHTLVNALLYHSPQLNELPRAGLVHRLDKDTSGLLLVAKAQKAYQILTENLKARDIHREYRAIAKGIMRLGGQLSAPIGRHRRIRTHMAVRDDGKPATTHYRILKTFQAHTYLSITLETGRTHQIRVHMAHLHHPLLGDPTYGKHINPKSHLPDKVLKILQTFKRQALHAYHLQLKHPITQKKLEFTAPLPEDFKQLLQTLSKVDY